MRSSSVAALGAAALAGTAVLAAVLYSIAVFRRRNTATIETETETAETETQEEAPLEAVAAPHKEKRSLYEAALGSIFDEEKFPKKLKKLDEDDPLTSSSPSRSEAEPDETSLSQATPQQVPAENVERGAAIESEAEVDDSEGHAADDEEENVQEADEIAGEEVLQRTLVGLVPEPEKTPSTESLRNNARRTPSAPTSESSQQFADCSNPNTKEEEEEEEEELSVPEHEVSETEPELLVDEQPKPEAPEPEADDVAPSQAASSHDSPDEESQYDVVSAEEEFHALKLVKSLPDPQPETRLSPLAASVLALGSIEVFASMLQSQTWLEGSLPAKVLAMMNKEADAEEELFETISSLSNGGFALLSTMKSGASSEPFEAAAFMEWLLKALNAHLIIARKNSGGSGGTRARRGRGGRVGGAKGGSKGLTDSFGPNEAHKFLSKFEVGVQGKKRLSVQVRADGNDLVDLRQQLLQEVGPFGRKNLIPHGCMVVSFSYDSPGAGFAFDPDALKLGSKSVRLAATVFRADQQHVLLVRTEDDSWAAETPDAAEAPVPAAAEWASHPRPLLQLWTLSRALL